VNISCFIIWITYALIQTGLLWWFDAKFESALHDSVISATSITLCCCIIANALNYYLPRKEKFGYVAVWGLVLAAVSIASTRWALYYIIADHGYLEQLDTSLPLRFFVNSLLIAFVAIINILWNIQQKTRKKKHQKLNPNRLHREPSLKN